MKSSFRLHNLNTSLGITFFKGTRYLLNQIMYLNIFVILLLKYLKFATYVLLFVLYIQDTYYIIYFEYIFKIKIEI